MTEHLYVRHRKDTNKYQVRIYTEDVHHSSSHKTLEAAVVKRNQVLGYDPDSVAQEERKPKILVIDIETTPMLAWVWQPWQTNVYPNQIKKDWEILCYGYKWLDDPVVHVLTRIEMSEKDLVGTLWDLLNEADVVVAHNGDKFDIKRIQTKLLLYKYQRPHPFKTVDTLKQARRYFDFTHNKLDYLGRVLEGDGKLEHSGMELWLGCMRGESDAWAEMIGYNKQDVLELELIYKTLRGWDPSHPNLGHYFDSDAPRCVSCGSEDLGEVEPVYTQVSAYPAFRCAECGMTMRGRKRFAHTTLVGGR